MYFQLCLGPHTMAYGYLLAAEDCVGYLHLENIYSALSLTDNTSAKVVTSGCHSKGGKLIGSGHHN